MSHRVLKTRARQYGGGSVPVDWSAGCGSADAFQCGGHGEMDQTVRFHGGQRRQRQRTGNEQRKSQVAAVLDDTPTRPPADELASRPSVGHGSHRIEITHGHRRSRPSVDPQQRVAAEAAEQRLIDGHVQRSLARCGIVDQLQPRKRQAGRNVHPAVSPVASAISSMIRRAAAAGSGWAVMGRPMTR